MNGILSECILQTIIICSTIISLAFVAVSAYRVYKEQKRDAGMYMFMSGVVVFVMVMIFSHAFCDNRNVLDFISLSSALISIILAVVTIIYSFYTNSRSSGQIDVLNKAAQKVQEATLSYSGSAESLQENIRQILATLSEVKDLSRRTNHAIVAGLGLKGVDSAIEGSKKRREANDTIDLLVTNYVNAGSYIGNIGLLACIYSSKNNRPLNLSDFSSIVESSDNFLGNYICGYIIASSALGVINARIEDQLIHVTNVYENLQMKIESMITNYIERQESKEAKEYNQRIYDNLKRLFETK